jgi:putative heme-binding domain-containing protein
MSLRLFFLGFLSLLVPALAEEKRGDNPDAPAFTPQEQLAKFHVPPGFEVQLVAAEPEIQKPINLTFDAAGRLWVTGSEMYPWPASVDALGQPIPSFDKAYADMAAAFRAGDKAPPISNVARDSVRILSDFGPNGRARKVEVFADGLNVPSGVQPLPRKPGAKGDTAIVYSIPNIWRLEDTDGDGKADKREVLYGMFGYLDTHGGSSSYLYWIDGWIYGTHGFRNHSEVRDRNGKVTVLDSGNTYRFRPDGSAFEIYTHGQTNPFGLTVDPLGNFYSADSHSKPVYMLLRGGYYEGIGKQHDGLGFAPRITDDDHGSSAIAGIAYYAAEQFPEEFRGNLFNGNPVTQKINRDKLEWHGSTPKAIRQPDFLSCDDPWFRPVQVRLGPDGALYIADFYNPIIGHYEAPLTDPRRDHAHGRIWRVVYRGENKDAPVAPMPDLAKLDAGGLIEKLADPNLVVRTLATNELVDRVQPTQALNALLEWMHMTMGKNGFRYDHSEPLAVLPIEWISTRLDVDWTSEAGQRLNSILLVTDSDVVRGVWADGAYAFGYLSDGNNPSRMRAAAQDISRDVARRLRAQSERKATTQAQITNRKLTSPSIPGLEPLHSPQEALAAEREAFLAQQWSDAESVSHFLKPLLVCLDYTPQDDTELIHAARMALRDCLLVPTVYEKAAIFAEINLNASAHIADVSLAVKTPEAAEFLLAHLGRTKLQSERSGEFLRHAVLYLPPEKLSTIAGLIESVKDAPLAQRLSIADNLTQAYRQRTLPLPAAFTDWTQRAMIESLTSSDDSVLKRGIEAVRNLSLAAKLEPLAKVTRDEKRDGTLRLAALEATAHLPASRELLLTTFQDSKHMILRKRAAELLAQSGQTDFVLTALPNVPDELAISIGGALARTDAGTTAFLDLIDAGKLSPRLLLNRAVSGPLTARPKPLRDRAAALVKDLPSEDIQMNAVIAERAATFAKAKPDVAHGAQVFQTNCAACHRFRNAGGNVGPNLDGVIARGPARLIEDILDPNRNVDPLFRQTTIETTDGDMLLVANLREQGDAIVFADPTGKETTIPKAKIKKQTASGLSLMPPIFESAIPATDFNDLLGYLLSPAASP